MASQTAGTIGRKALAYVALTKPRLSSLVLATTAIGFYLGSRAPEIDLGQLVLTVLGTALAAGGSCAINMVMERNFDTHMARTASRPLQTGTLTPRQAAVFAYAISIAGVFLLSFAVEPLAGLLAAVAWLVYVLIYTPLKRVTSLNTLVGAIPGALPPVIGWAAAAHELGAQAWLLFAIVFVWQIPHFFAIATIYGKQYRDAGFPMLPSLEHTKASSARQTIAYSLVLIPISLLPTATTLAGPLYFAAALVLGLAFAAVSVHLAWAGTVRAARRLFISSLAYLPLLLTVLAWDKR